jgi:phytoene dehydrogenase-like protein
VRCREAVCTLGRLLSLGKDLPRLIEFLLSPASKVLDSWFESDILKATLATDAVVGAMIAPSSQQSAYVLLHHVMSGPWCNVRGGMGALSRALARSAEESGAEIRVNSPVRRILLQPSVSGLKDSQAVRGVELCDGSVIECSTVLSASSPHTTFISLLADHPETANALPSDFLRRVRALDVRSGSVKINVALNALPSFLCLPNVAPGVPGPQHRGTVHFETSMEQIESAFRDAQVRRVCLVGA